MEEESSEADNKITYSKGDRRRVVAGGKDLRRMVNESDEIARIGGTG